MSDLAAMPAVDAAAPQGQPVVYMADPHLVPHAAGIAPELAQVQDTQQVLESAPLVEGVQVVVAEGQQVNAAQPAATAADGTAAAPAGSTKASKKGERNSKKPSKASKNKNKNKS
mmetsp:Transcript_38900/g.77195  ORF Transcript_38900/g.77195 Transcript_38900/m.77195 type:complete len:115 (-) Transcript_38900:381-725(-)